MHFLHELKKDFWMPYFMPVVWYGIFAAGVGIGIWVWLYMLRLRGLL